MNSGLKQCALARNKTRAEQKSAGDEACQDGTGIYLSCLGHAHLFNKCVYLNHQCLPRTIKGQPLPALMWMCHTYFPIAWQSD